MAKSVDVYQVFLSSRFPEFGALRKAIVDRQNVFLPVQAKIGFLVDRPVWPDPPSATSTEQVKNADVAIVIIGNSYDEPPKGFSKNYAHLEFEAAKGGPVLAYLAASPDSASSDDARLKRFVAQVKRHCDVAELDLSDINRASDRILLDLRTMLDELEEAGQPVSGLPAAASLGREIFSTATNEWRNHQIGPLDRHVFGEPKMREETVDSVNLVGRSDDLWNEACRAFDLGSATLMIDHLRRALEVRPLDGEARYWMARLELGAPADTATYKDVAEHAALAAASLVQNEQEAQAGLAHLIEAKALRVVGDHENGLAAARRSVELLGDTYFEPHLEVGYLATACGRSLEAFDATREAFTIAPPCLGPARAQFKLVEGGLDVLADCEWRLAVEAEGQVTAMHRYGQELFEHAKEVAGVSKIQRVDLDYHLQLAGEKVGDEDEDEDDDGGDESEEKRDPFKVTPPVAYRGEMTAGKPVEVVRDGVSKAAENLERLRDLEALLQESAAGVRDARLVRNLALARTNGRVRRMREGFGWGLVAVFALMLIPENPNAWYLLGLVPIAAIVGIVLWRFAEDWQENIERFGSAEQLAATLEQAWKVEAKSFEDFVERYERVHLGWRSYGPRSIFADHIDRDVDTRLHIRRIASDKLGGSDALMGPLAPDFRELDASIPVVFPGSSRAKTNHTAHARRGSPSGQDRHHLLGYTERGKSSSKLAPAQWLAYRRVGSGPTRIDGSSTTVDPWWGAIGNGPT